MGSFNSLYIPNSDQKKITKIYKVFKNVFGAIRNVFEIHINQFNMLRIEIA